MRTASILPACLALVPLVAAHAAWADPPTGSLDAAQWNLIGGWARDPDTTAPILVHIYVDGQLAHAMVADGVRPDLPFADQAHGFSWVPPLLGPGNHAVIVYAIGALASGAPDGENPGLMHSPRTIAAGCTGFTGSAAAWCAGVPGYYTHRADDTVYLYSDAVRVGVDRSYGGTIFQLYGADHTRNLLVEHGGAAVQLSIWGYENVGDAAYFGDGNGVCDPHPYPTEAECRAHDASCRLWGASGGAHVADCVHVRSCVGWGAGAPFNPIQAQAVDCGWDSPTNDCDVVTTAANAVYMHQTAPYHFTKSSAMAGMAFSESVHLLEAGVQIDYRIQYSGPYQLGPHPQEIPAVFPGPGIHYSYAFYTGTAPYADATSAVTTVVAPSGGLLLDIAGRGPYPHGPSDTVITESWVSACNADGSQCVTVAALSDVYKEINAAAYPGNGEGYLTPLGGFAITPGMDLQFSAYLFPYRYDRVVAGRTIRQWIYTLQGATPPAVDAGTTAVDASTALDEGIETDAHAAVDASGRADASERSDAGLDGGRSSAHSGCGCSTPGPARGTSAAALSGLAVAWATRRRGRRAR